MATTKDPILESVGEGAVEEEDGGMLQELEILVSAIGYAYLLQFFKM